VTKLQSNEVFIDTYIREASLALNTINYIFDGHEEAINRGIGYHELNTSCHIKARNKFKGNKTTSKWIESSTNYDNHWMALREAHIDWECQTGNEHHLSAILMNLENCPRHMNRVEDAEPAPTLVSCGFKVLPKLNINDKLICTFKKYSHKLEQTYFKEYIEELNFI